MTDKTVTHADLETLRRLRNKDEHLREWSRAEIDATDDLLDRLIAVAEADAPPLPEGWVLLVGDDGVLYPYWHEDNRLSSGKGKAAYKIEATAASMRDRLTPLRPTITEADVDRAARELAIRQEKDDEAWALAVEAERNDYRLDVRAAFAAAGVVIEP